MQNIRKVVNPITCGVVFRSEICESGAITFGNRLGRQPPERGVHLFLYTYMHIHTYIHTCMSVAILAQAILLELPDSRRPPPKRSANVVGIARSHFSIFPCVYIQKAMCIYIYMYTWRGPPFVTKTLLERQGGPGNGDPRRCRRRPKVGPGVN